jgi:hypothetical protein
VLDRLQCCFLTLVRRHRRHIACDGALEFGIDAIETDLDGVFPLVVVIEDGNVVAVSGLSREDLCGSAPVSPSTGRKTFPSSATFH